MIKFIVVNPFDFILYMMPYSHLFRSLSQVFYKINSVEFMREHGIEVVPIINFLESPNLKYDLMDYNACQKYYPPNATMSHELKTAFDKCISIFIEKVKTTNVYNGSVIYAIMPMAFNSFTPHINLLKSKNIKLLMYCDDIHFFSTNHCPGVLIYEPDVTKLRFKSPIIDYASYVLTMSKYFHHIGVYQEKIKFYYVPPDDIIFSMYSPLNFFERKNKILLTGCLDGYPLRYMVSQNYKIPEWPNHAIARENYDILEFIGYNSDKSIEVCKLSGLCSYYNKLSEYQGAFVGYHRKPLDHIVWKVFEILATGTLLFSQENPGLEELGLKKFVHYIPMTFENIFDRNYLRRFLGTEEGKKIATNGYNFIREFNDNRKNLTYFIHLIRQISA